MGGVYYMTNKDLEQYKEGLDYVFKDSAKLKEKLNILRTGRMDIYYKSEK